MPLINVPCSTNICCEHGDLIEENAKLKATIEKVLVSCIQGKETLDELLSNQRDNVSKEGIGYVPKPKKKNSKKKKANKKKSVQAQETGDSG